jgi:hypothetical protein
MAGLGQIENPRSHVVQESSEAKRAETRAFWETAIRLWKDCGLSVREFCRREGLAEHSFYWWRRALMPRIAAAEGSQESSDEDDSESAGDGRRRRKRKPANVSNRNNVATPFIECAAPTDVATPFIELVTPTSAELCRCTLELENASGAKMRIQLRSAEMPDLAAISQSFWNRDRTP